ncbi:hypothetical protein [Zobellella iuensis]|uniref:Nucleotidyltransferase n=1 Tax=Zobellella iuensis TaxID=2803811 RepID=A0ABS1QMG2_9GAMM|nr:hypothetical protein [Zobellella iuensis]MBL1376044.1 hypothetical protein [Zobellella iuensis]
MNRIGDNLICTGANKEIVQAFAASNVEFVVVGGLAVAWYCPSREVDDMDLLVNPSPANSERIYRALSSFNLNGLERNSFSKAGIQLPLKRHHYADIITPPKDGLTFEEIIRDSIEGNLFNIPVRIPSVAHLIALKKYVITSAEKQINKHLKDIELLQDCAV